MKGYKSVLFEPRVRVKMLEEFVYPSIFRSSWQNEEKIRALFRHKLRKSIKGRDAKEREELCNALNALYSYYIAFIPAQSESVEEVSTSARWIKARIEMKLSEEPNSQVKVDICEEIGRLRELLLSE